MKCDLNISEDSSMSGITGHCSRKFRVLALVVNTANLINERSTKTLSISHAILAPITFITTYICLGILTVGACQKRYASDFLQIYSLVSCCSLQTSLSILVFNDLKKRNSPVTDKDVAMVLNGVLPIFTIMLIVADLIVILFSKRDDITLPYAGSHSDLGRAQTHSITVLPNRGGENTEKPDPAKPGTDQRTLRIEEPEAMPSTTPQTTTNES